jgi:hypothetical protein
VKLYFPDEQSVRIAHRKKATVAKLRIAAAAELQAPVEKIVLRYGDTELTDAVVIDSLSVPRRGRISVTLLD